LLAEIQGKSVANLRATPTGGAAVGGAAVGGAAVGGAAGAAAGAAAADDGGAADLASTLAAALNMRKGNMGDSDEESEDDEDW